jgi:hypothetical protein
MIAILSEEAACAICSSERMLGCRDLDRNLYKQAFEHSQKCGLSHLFRTYC